MDVFDVLDYNDDAADQNLTIGRIFRDHLNPFDTDNDYVFKIVIV